MLSHCHLYTDCYLFVIIYILMIIFSLSFLYWYSFSRYHLHTDNHLPVKRRTSGAGETSRPGWKNSWGDFPPKTAPRKNSWGDFVNNKKMLPEIFKEGRVGLHHMCVSLWTSFTFNCDSDSFWGCVTQFSSCVPVLGLVCSVFVLICMRQELAMKRNYQKWAFNRDWITYILLECHSSLQLLCRLTDNWAAWQCY